MPTKKKGTRAWPTGSVDLPSLKPSWMSANQLNNLPCQKRWPRTIFSRSLARLETRMKCCPVRVVICKLMDIAGGDVSKHWRRRRERIRLLDEGNIDICNSFGKTSSASPSSRASSGVPKINLDTTERGGSLRVVCYTFLSRKALYQDTALTCSGQVVWPD